MTSQNPPDGSHLRRALISGLAYGLGLLAGTVVVYWIADNLSLQSLAARGGLSDLAAGILLTVAVVSIGGGIGGWVGGWTLPTVGRPRGRWGYAWPSALGLGLWFGGMLFLGGAVVSLFSFYDVYDLPAGQFALAFAVLGAVYGALVGLLLGLLTVGWRRTGWVVLAGMVGFALGGVGLGLGLRAFLMSVPLGTFDRGQRILLLLGLFVLGLGGGAALGLVYSRLAERPSKYKAGQGRPGWRMLLVYVALAAGIVLALALLSPLFERLSVILTPRSARLNQVIDADVVGTHWSDPQLVADDVDVASPVGAPEIAVSASGQVALVWSAPADGQPAAQPDVRYWAGTWEGQSTTWSPRGVDVSNSPAAASLAPQVALDRAGTAHVVWVEAGDGGHEILYSRCGEGQCAVPLRLSGPTSLSAAPSGPVPAPAIAVNGHDVVMVAWPDGADGLAYGTWAAAEAPVSAMTSNVPLADVPLAGEQRLSGRADGSFVLVFNSDSGSSGEIQILRWVDESWEAPSQAIGTGRLPEIVMDREGTLHAAWCEADGLVYWSAGQAQTPFSTPCKSRPGLAQDSEGRMHVAWYADQVENALGRTASHDVIVESIEDDDNWLPPAIVARPDRASPPALAAGADGVLHMAWSEAGPAHDAGPAQDALAYATQVQYDCSAYPLSGIAREVYDIARQDTYQPPGDIVPYCQNHFDRLWFTPNSDPAFSDHPPTPNGGFDGFADLVRSARYEVLFTTMQYEQDHQDDSPGSVLAAAVADLYRQLEENPARYPRGLTVRILLGNSPQFVSLELNGQLWHVLDDLRDAGVPEMANPELGWRLEVANYEGAWPHSHVKEVVVDGRTVIGAGYNMKYNHLALDHPSGLGKGTVDAATQVTGPVAQDGRRAFDELWTGSTRRHCRDFYPPHRAWRLTCQDAPAVSDHVPEVMRYYLPGGESTAFSMLRTERYDESDREIVQALASAQESLDVLQVMFAMPMICNLNHFFEACTSEQAMPYLASIVEAAENGARVRLLLNLQPVLGIENEVGVDILMRELERRGVRDQVEIRAIDRRVHAKNALVDDEFLIIGSQNYHYSAFGPGTGLAEYSLGVDDPRAVEAYRRMYDYYWERARALDLAPAE